MAAAIDSAQLQMILQYFDFSYVRTIPGYLKIGQLANALIGFIISEFADEKFSAVTGWFSFVAMGGFWVTFILLLVYMLHLYEKIVIVPWVQLEMSFTGLWCGLFLISFISCAINAADDGIVLVLTIFSLAGMGLYGTDAFFKFKAYKASATEQGYSAGPEELGGEMGQYEQQTDVVVDQSGADNFPAY